MPNQGGMVLTKEAKYVLLWHNVGKSGKKGEYYGD